MPRLDIMSNKGGVGKTFVTIGLAESLARFGRRVLVVDLDPQANATDALGVFTPSRTLADVLNGTVSNGAAAGLAHRHQWAGYEDLHIDVLPSELALEDITMQAGMPGSHGRLRRALYGVDDEYDFTLIDCPPSMGHLAANALAALDDCDGGDTVIVPLTPNRRAISGAIRVRSFIELYAEHLGICAEITGLIANMVRDTNTHNRRMAELPATFPGVPVLGSVQLRAAVDGVADRAQPLAADRSPEGASVRQTFDHIANDLINREAVTA